jgi:heme O synthase-like polyprenyltransferase
MVALATSAGYAATAWRFVRTTERRPARHLFLTSLVVLPLLLGALVTDLLIG